MKEQFTQDDWSFQANDSYIELHAGGKMIGDLSMGSNTCTEAELKANAHLFKVAPKMYHKLGELVWFLENMHECDRDWTVKESTKLHREIGKLLAEARGENNEHSD